MKNDINHSCTDEPDLTAKSRTKLKKENKNSYFDTLDASSVFDLDIRLQSLLPLIYRVLISGKCIHWFLTKQNYVRCSIQ